MPISTNSVPQTGPKALPQNNLAAIRDRLEKSELRLARLEANRKPAPLLLSQLEDTGPLGGAADGDAVVWDRASGQWVPGSSGSGGYASLTGGAPPSGVTNNPGNLIQTGGLIVDGGTTGQIILTSKAFGGSTSSSYSVYEASVALFVPVGGEGISIQDESDGIYVRTVDKMFIQAGAGFQIRDDSATGMSISESGSGGMDISSTGLVLQSSGGLQVLAATNGIAIQDSSTSATGNGIQITTTAENGITIEASAATANGLQLISTATTASVGIALQSHCTTSSIVLRSYSSTASDSWQGAGAFAIDFAGDVLIASDSGTVTINANSNKVLIEGSQVQVDPLELGFFGATPTGQQVSGGTTAGVIAGLVALGLFAS